MNVGSMVGVLGTSPRTRGKLRATLLLSPWVRNIPAHAGKTHFTKLVRPPNQEHPRARGENLLDELIPLVRSGTSPRTRGKPLRSGETPGRVRNIPAHAGKTLSRKRSPPEAREHPRARGENRRYGGGRPHERGTSPRTRGKLPIGENPIFEPRNIPAHAGKT